MKEKQTFLHIFFIIVFSSLLMSFIDGYYNPPYIIKTGLKLVLFLLIPLIYLAYRKPEAIRLKQLFSLRFKYLKEALILALSVFLIIIIAYFIASPLINLNQIKDNLINNLNVNKDNFIFVALYISLVNSFIEEFFFRAFAFMILKDHSTKFIANIISSLMFALYHIGMTITWFNPLIFTLALASLFIAGLIFNYLNLRSDSIYPSWLVHMFANFAINTIGLILFGII